MTAGPKRQSRELSEVPVVVRKQAPDTAAFGVEAAAWRNQDAVGGHCMGEEQQERPAWEERHPAGHLAAEGVVGAAPSPGVVMNPAQGL